MKEYKLGEICTFIGGGTPSKSIDYYWNGDIPWASVKDLKEKYISETELSISFDGVKNSSTNIANKDDLILCTRISPGKCAITLKETAINQDLKIVRPIIQNLYINEYLYYQFILLENEIISLSSGSTVKGITLEKIKELQVKLPTIDEQKRIVNILDIAQALIDKRKQAIAKLDELVQAVFLDMFGDPATNQKGYPIGTIKDLIIEAKYGTSKKANESTGQFPYLRMNNITYQGYMDYSNLKYIDLDDKEQEKYLVQKGDLLFNRTNSKELVGKTAVFDSNEKMALAGYIVRVRTNDKGNPYFISGYLNSKHGKKVLQEMCKNIIGMANINAQELQNIAILIPPREMQDIYERKFKVILEEKEKHLAQLQQLESNFQALLQKAFKGELTVKDGVAV